MTFCSGMLPVTSLPDTITASVVTIRPAPKSIIRLLFACPKIFINQDLPINNLKKYYKWNSININFFTANFKNKYKLINIKKINALTY
jgi:hypothetical protein